MGLRAVTFVVWALLAGCAVYWVLMMSSGRASAGAVVAPPTAAARVDSSAVGRVLGATVQAATPQESAASRFALQGVVAGSPGGGAALIAVDGQPAQAFKVGSAVSEGLVLKSTGARRAVLAAGREGPALITLDMPAL